MVVHQTIWYRIKYEMISTTTYTISHITPILYMCMYYSKTCPQKTLNPDSIHDESGLSVSTPNTDLVDLD